MIAQTGGLTYSLPQRQQFAQQQPEMQQQAPQQGSPFSAPIGEDLAYVENLTNNYYNAYGRLKDFTETMWKDYGVDVTKPDFAQPGGGLMHQAFQKMDADLRMTANDLVEERKIREEQRKAVLEGKAMYAPGYQEQAQLARTLQPQQRVIPTDLLPEVQQAIQGVSNRVYNTPQEAQRAFATLQPLIDKYTNLAKTDTQNAQYYQRQIDALRQPTYSLPDVAFRPPSARDLATTQEQANYLTMARKIANDWKGNWTEGITYEYDPVLKQQVAVVVPEAGLMLGKATIDGKNEVDKIVKKYIKAADGAVYAVFDNPKIPRERLDNKSADEAVTTVISRNPKFGGEKAINFLNQIRGTAGTYEPTALYANPEEYTQIQQRAQAETQGLAAKQQILADVKAKISKRMPTSGQLGMSFLWDTPVNIKELFADYPEIASKIPDARIETQSGGYKFKDGKEFKALTGMESGSTKIYTEDEIIDFLAPFVGEVVNLQSPAQTSTQAPVTKKTITQAQFEQAAKQKGAVTPADMAAYKKQVEAKGFIIQ